MAGKIAIRQATYRDLETVAGILQEAVRWLEREGKPLWRAAELSPEGIAADVSAGLFFLAESSGDAAGTVRFQLTDPQFWADALRPDATYVHRLAVRRRYAGTGLSTAILCWAAEHTRELGRRVLRLDCEASRPRLRQIYESFGFFHHSDRQVGPYFVSRYEYDLARLPSRGQP